MSSSGLCLTYTGNKYTSRKCVDALLWALSYLTMAFTHGCKLGWFVCPGADSLSQSFKCLTSLFFAFNREEVRNLLFFLLYVTYFLFHHDALVLWILGFLWGYIQCNHSFSDLSSTQKAFVSIGVCCISLVLISSSGISIIWTLNPCSFLSQFHVLFFLFLLNRLYF